MVDGAYVVRWTIERADGSRVEVRDRIDQRGFHNWIVKVKDAERRTRIVWHVIFTRAWEAVHGPEEKYRGSVVSRRLAASGCRDR